MIKSQMVESLLGGWGHEGVEREKGEVYNSCHWQTAPSTGSSCQWQTAVSHEAFGRKMDGHGEQNVCNLNAEKGSAMRAGSIGGDRSSNSFVAAFRKVKRGQLASDGFREGTAEQERVNLEEQCNYIAQQLQ